MSFEGILKDVSQYYGDKILSHGATPQGVDWNSSESQRTRFEQLLKVCDVSRPFSINDYGCGYGALVDVMVHRRLAFRYYGFDISRHMIAKAEEAHQGMENCKFHTDRTSLPTADYALASGILNIRLDHDEAEWLEYVLHEIGNLNELGECGFAFNMLSKYSDPERMRPDLYYGDPCFFFDYCKKRFSKWVALLHDYGLYEFTILVRKPQSSPGVHKLGGPAK